MRVRIHSPGSGSVVDPDPHWKYGNYTIEEGWSFLICHRFCKRVQIFEQRIRNNCRYRTIDSVRLRWVPVHVSAKCQSAESKIFVGYLFNSDVKNNSYLGMHGGPSSRTSKNFWSGFWSGNLCNIGRVVPVPLNNSSFMSYFFFDLSVCFMSNLSVSLQLTIYVADNVLLLLESSGVERPVGVYQLYWRW